MGELIDGKYEVLSKIKEGGMGAIFKVRHVLLEDICVIKTMRAQIEDDPSARKRFYQEARLAKTLKHPNIASLIDFIEDQNHTFYMVMEFIDGPNLAELLSSGGPPPVPITLEIGIQALDALGYLHRKGIVHRDISPENLMLTPDEGGHITVKLIDLGVAKDTGTAGMTVTGMFVGKLKYSSPEQLGTLHKGEMIDGRSDIYSLGCVLYQLLTGETAFMGDSHQSWILAHIRKPARPFEETDPGGRVPADVRQAVLKALAKRREDRWGTAEELAATLRASLARLLSGETPSSPLDEPIEVGVERTLKLFRKPGSPGPPAASLSAEGRQLAWAFDHAVSAPSGLIPAPSSGSAVSEAPARAKVLAERPAAPTSKARSPWLYIGAAAVVLTVVVAMAIALFGRKPPPPPPNGILLVTASPWGRVTQVVNEATGQPVPLPGEAVTPARLSLPAGRYRVTVHSGPAAERQDTRSIEVPPNGEQRVHFPLPGFDPEQIVRAYVP